jgi:hypothetical protein
MRLLFIASQQMEIGTKPIPTSVLTAVTSSALNAASRRIEISDSHTDLNRSADISIQIMDAALQDFEVSARVRGLGAKLFQCRLLSNGGSLLPLEKIRFLKAAHLF